MRRINWMLILVFAALALVIVYVVCTGKVKADDSYGEADFSRRDAWTKDKVLACWDLDPGLRADELQGNGSMETWTGTEGGCTDCPTGMTCLCVGPCDIEQETTYVYDGNTSVKVTIGATDDSTVRFDQTWEAGENYLVTFWIKGATGVEDIKIRLFGAVDYYDPAADTWGAVATFAITNTPVTWTQYAIYVKGDAGDQVGGIYLRKNTINQVWYVDGFEIRKLYSTIDSDTGYTLTVDVGADPVFGNRQSFFKQGPSTGPPLRRGLYFDGTDDFLERADDDSFDSSSHFSVGCQGVIPDSVAVANKGIIAKDDAGAERGWNLNAPSTGAELRVWGAGGNKTAAVANAWTVGASTNLVGTFRSIGASTGVITLRANNLTETQHLNASSFPVNAAVNLNIGKYGNNEFSGIIERCCFWDKELSAVERNKWVNPYFPGNNHGDGFWVDTCSQAASHATCSWSFCRDGTPNLCQAEPTGWMGVFGEFTELCDDNSFETFTGDDSNPSYPQWGESGTLAYRADKRHGAVSARMISSSSMSSGCIIGGGTDVYVELFSKYINGGTEDLSIWFREYDTGICTDQLQIDMTTDCDSGADWTACYKLVEAADWHADTSSYKIQIVNQAGNVLVDTVSIKVASHRTPWVHNEGAGSTTYNDRDYRLYNPLVEYIQDENAYGYENGFCFAALVHNDWEADDATEHIITFISTTGGTSNLWSLSKTSSNRIQFVLYDSAGALRYMFTSVTDTNWTAGDWKYVEACSNNTDDTIKLQHYNYNNATWYVTSTIYDVGTGIQDDQHAEMYIGHSTGGAFFNGYIHKIYITPYSAVFPNKGFNGGRSPPPPY